MKGTARQTLFLFCVDAATNLFDYLFHIYLGRSLGAADFATAQTINAALMTLATAFGVTQPVVARAVADATAQNGTEAESRGLFQTLFRYGVGLGLVLGVVLWLGQGRVASWLNVPPVMVALIAAMPLLVLLRPLTAGVLQGEQRFVAFGLARASFALARLGVGVLLVSLGWGGIGAVAAMPVAALLALACSLTLAGAAVWQPAPSPGLRQIRTHLSLCAAAFVAYTAYMGLQNNDLIWVNRLFPTKMAGAYASAVLLRRVLALLPGAVIVVLYPLVVGQVAQGRLPDRLLTTAASVVMATTGTITLFYGGLSAAIVEFTFGGAYPEAAPLLGWMGIGMMGYGLTAVWMNLYLATRPWLFALFLALMAGGQIVLINLNHPSLLAVTLDFVITGWLLAVGGLLLYLLWFRPQFRQAYG